MLLYYQNISIPFGSVSEDLSKKLGAGMEKLPYIIADWLVGKNTFAITSSGSTGTPKPILLKRPLIEYSAHLTADSFGITENDNLLCCLSMDYIAGMMMAFRALVLNCNLILAPINANPLNGIGEAIRIDFVSFVPLQIQSILENAIPSQINILNGMKAILVGGGPVSKPLAVLIRKLQAPVYHTYSMTETYTHVAIRRLNGSAATEAYYPLKDVKLSQDERGCLCISSPITEAETLITNDLVEINPDGGFIWLGRYDNVINSGGIKIQLEETEEIIKSILDEAGRSANFTATGIADEKLGQRLILIIEQEHPDAWQKEKLLPLLTEKMPRHKAPKEIYFTTTLQYTHTGKIDRKASLAHITHR